MGGRSKRFGKTTCIQPYNDEKKIIEALDNEVKKLWLNDDMLAWLETEKRLEKEASKDKGIRVKKDLEDQRIKLEKRKRRINVMRSDGELNKDEFLEMKADITEELNFIEQKLTEIKKSSVDIEGQIEIVIDLLYRLRNTWETLNLEEKSEVLRIMTQKIILGREGRDTLEIIWDNPWDALFDLPIENGWYARTDSNCRPTDS